MKRIYFNYMVSVLVLLPLLSCTNRTAISAEETEAIAEEAYIYAYPMLENYKTLFVTFLWEASPAYEGPFNILRHSAELRGPEYTAVIRPNTDTYYSSVGMDLRREPMVLSVPAITDNRYYSFQLIDMYTHNFGYIGTRTTGFDAGNYLIAGPSWDGATPDGIENVLQSECKFIVALGRTQVNGAKDAASAKAVMEGFQAMPLSQFLGEQAPPTPEPLDFPPYDPEKAESADFITYLNFLLGQVDPHPSEADLFERFAAIGIGPNVPFDVSKLDPETKAAIERGIDRALSSIEAKTRELGEEKNGWMLLSGAFGNREDMQGKYLTRAAAAMFGLYGNDQEEAFYPAAETDADGEPLDGSKHSYILHFEADEIPPVNAFWSLTMYKLPEQLFIENEINRYKIGSATEGLTYNTDGSLDIYIQASNPGTGKVANWLPAHDGPFSLQARMYWPKEEALDPLYVPPPVRKRDQ